jgi:hypothetical protein
MDNNDLLFRQMSDLDDDHMKDDLKDVITNYINGEFKKPLMIVVYPEHPGKSSNTIVDECRNWIGETYKKCHIMGHPLKLGNKYCIVDGKMEKISDHPELMNSLILPGEYNENTQIFEYYRYVSQLEKEHLEYVVALFNKLKLPCICLINDYNYEKQKQKGDVDLSDFDVVLYNWNEIV